VMGQFEFWLFVSRSRKLKLTHHRQMGSVDILPVRESEEGFFDCVPRPPKGGGKTKSAGLRSE
ncbi:MAG: hypothetical protein WA175_00415, partial [Candidatus Acidiferrales bacterium]